jgi:tetratricopeptide (TPR) repeat protein
MSLLLEALKKAEKAKEEAQRQVRSESESAATVSQLEPAPALELEGARPALRIAGEEPDPAEPTLTLAEEKPAPPEVASLPAREPASASRPPRAQPPTDPQAPERAAARKVFEAKFREPNPRLPFFITMGALGVFALGVVIYFWMALRPPSVLLNTNPPRPVGESQVAAVETKPGAGAPASTSGPTPIAGLPGSATPAVPRTPVTPAAAPVTPLVPAAAPTATPRAEAPRLQAPRRTAPEISASRAVPQVHPKVGTGYAAYGAGDLATARTEYQQALAEEPANRDALLGLAAVDVRAGRFEAADAAYVRLLQADPRDAHAHAALMALRGGRMDPVAAESRVKSMLADNPAAHVLNFTLGNQLAQQGRWAEAQQEYFKAFAAEPDNADFAYNLAVSLDHLRQPKLALEYYQRALTLAKGRGASFDRAAAELRVAQLGR